MGRMKPNPLLAKLEAQHELDLDFQRSITVQQCADMMLISAADEFGFGEDRLVRLHKRFEKVYRDYAALTVSDSKDDKSIVYTKEKLDRKLKQILGDHFTPFDERYKMM